MNSISEMTLLGFIKSISGNSLGGWGFGIGLGGVLGTVISAFITSFENYIGNIVRDLTGLINF